MAKNELPTLKKKQQKRTPSRPVLSDVFADAPFLAMKFCFIFTMRRKKRISCYLYQLFQFGRKFTTRQKHCL